MTAPGMRLPRVGLGRSGEAVPSFYFKVAKEAECGRSILACTAIDIRFACCFKTRANSRNRGVTKGVGTDVLDHQTHRSVREPPHRSMSVPCSSAARARLKNADGSR